MTSRASSAAADRTGRSDGDAERPGPGAIIALALARALTLERVAIEAVQQLGRITGVEGAAVALSDGDDPDTITGMATVGGLDAASLDPVWRECATSGTTAIGESPAGTLVTAPLPGPGTALGAITVLVGAGPDAPQPARVGAHLEALAVHVAAAVDRAYVIQRNEQRTRLEAIGDVAAGLAHELRNPLFGISSAAQLLRFRVNEDPVVEKNVGRVLREVEQLNSVVTSLLEYGRTAPLRPTTGDPDAVLDDVLARGRGKLESKALRVVRTRADPPATCAIDASQLAQAFTGLLDNAVDAAPEGTDLALTSVVLPSGAWRARLANGGPTIPPDVLGRVFDLFVTTKPNGTGIGLALSQRIVEEHRGRISIESTGPAGTAVAVTLPPSAGTDTPSIGSDTRDRRG